MIRLADFLRSAITAFVISAMFLEISLYGHAWIMLVLFLLVLGHDTYKYLEDKQYRNK